MNEIHVKVDNFKIIDPLASSEAFSVSSEDGHLVIRMPNVLVDQLKTGQAGHPNLIQDIVDFHVKFGQENTQPLARVLPHDLFAFRNGFHFEEAGEYDDAQDQVQNAVEANNAGAVVQGLADQLDALVDSAYVILGTAYLQFGADRFAEAWRRVHGKNMEKIRCERDEDSKRGNGAKFDVIKPEGWTPPDHTDLVNPFFIG